MSAGRRDYLWTLRVLTPKVISFRQCLSVIIVTYFDQDGHTTRDKEGEEIQNAASVFPIMLLSDPPYVTSLSGKGIEFPSESVSFLPSVPCLSPSSSSSPFC